MNSKVSIVIPVYNSEKYISQMLDCINKQSYENIEIIIAYDSKSTDRTLEILKVFQKESPHNVVIDIDSDNSIGEARNRGYKFVTGEFVIFLDADDYILPTMIDDYLQGLIYNPKCNISTGKYQVNLTRKKFVKQLMDMKVKNAETLIYEYVSPPYVLNNIWANYKYTNASWNYLFRKSFLDQYNLTFPNMSHGEDQIFMVSCLKHAKWIAECNHYGYVYIVHKNSASHLNMRKQDEFLHQHDEFRVEYEKLIGADFPTIPLYAGIEYLTTNLFYNTSFTYEEFLENLMKKGIYKIPLSPVINWKQKCAIHAFNINPKLFYIGCRIYKRLIQKENIQVPLPRGEGIVH